MKSVFYCTDTAEMLFYLAYGEKPNEEIINDTEEEKIRTELQEAIADIKLYAENKDKFQTLCNVLSVIESKININEILRKVN